MDLDLLKSSILEHILDTSYHPFLKVVENKDSSVSIWAKTSLVAKIKSTRSGDFLEIKDKYSDIFYNIPAISKNNGTAIIALDNDSCVLGLSCEISELYMSILAELGGERFGCCSRYEECSNARKCLHPDKIIAAACAYKRNLESGKIFFGKNKNA